MAIGLDVDTPPEPENPEEYDYEKCPFYGELSVRGQILEGTVVSTDMDKTVVVEREYDVAVPKYDRHMKRRSRIPAHVPGVLEPLSVGDTVKIAETRPLSKTKSHVVVEVTEEATAEDLAELTSQAEPEPALSDEDLAAAEEGDQ
ncbi:30S ribosomal protein S17P [Natrinema pellirubrum DSM 15624]|uniref:Small ribosomal subunit protein uS17 n=2 Tax=Natrinema TaxID=88723 RepID=L0JH14_NATP1|nr:MULTISPECIES: 30S ribosomal protein S17 [Natrinema]ELZ08838.1 30S ribosomal protein S17P [Natrinema thermotolerans DSM 11552]AGB30795.1 archaeal ribosomal protein S17P [Natrinema pellirubrum DSM 15624]ELY80819.1 30S ribosomal protein S17P [Natrinema pellirubrum DSM 15624]QCC59629.1 30S ribosomal protein S17 [Natrinema thermotolerans]WMT06606.1 30S ribosomal protein S17 [Natrinema thermotolerans]